MKSSTVLSFFIPVLVTALPQGPGSYNAPSGYNAPKPGYNATPPPAAGGLGGLVGGLTGSLPLVGGLLGGGSSNGAWSPCAGTTGSAQCCATDVLGVADLDCLTPTRTPHSRREFDDVCSAKGQRARCCALPILGQALICSSPV